eukprot:Cvel_12794.t1-p1 / transcript=Cvel_12794.t1 / gene=Cvel_12794 / organism=Chromera_velia_CCMP2878 / gene_product=hypothetical protein / transcript_product=hypothetical protein / location=Cvel_scaffold852:138-1342(-) / protein_length=174 / sequence_SO=supercontig / SO=protein_coding / is_pseudo=false
MNSRVKFFCGGSSQTHHQKLYDYFCDEPPSAYHCINDDAWVASSSFVCVADGVGSIRSEHGLDGSALPKELVLACAEKLQPPRGLSRRVPLSDLVMEAVQNCSKMGASTVCTARIVDGSVMESLNLGDCGWHVLRRVGAGAGGASTAKTLSGTSEWRVVDSSRSSVMAFNVPLQ